MNFAQLPLAYATERLKNFGEFYFIALNYGKRVCLEKLNGVAAR
jgi:hypothetical protein